MESFEDRNRKLAEQMHGDTKLDDVTRDWFGRVSRYEYSYHFTWLGRPIIQFPQDIVATQEILWSVKPDLVIETGVARGGSLILSASILELVGGPGEVLGIDIDIRPHNRVEIEKHPLAKRISLLQGSSVDPALVEQVRARARGKERVMVFLDSNHTHEHVLRELQMYSPLVTKGSYLVVFDTVIERMPPSFVEDRPWGPGNNPMTALREFMSKNDRFVLDHDIENKLLISVAPGGYLKCIKD
jgi:cephalosporin hydroxylase